MLKYFRSNYRTSIRKGTHGKATAIGNDSPWTQLCTLPADLVHEILQRISSI